MSENASSMRAARVPSASDHRLEIVEVPVPQPPAGSVRIRVEACGVCHSDTLTVEAAWPGVNFPRVPGHEVAGRIDAVGENVVGWQTGDRVGVGWHGGHCGHCDRCRRGDFITCRNLQVPGIAYDGGYAEYMIAPAVALARLPEDISSQEAAPLMCAGITTFNALRNSPARPGDLVAILGIGGLGHLAVQYAAKMGFRTVAIARGSQKQSLALQLGAHRYLDSEAVDVAAELQRLGGAKVALATATVASAMEPLLGGLSVDGELLIVGAASDPLQANTLPMLLAKQSIKGWPSGTCVDSEDTLNFSALTGVRAEIETMPLERAQEAYDKMMAGKARFRMVLVTA